MLPTYTSMNKIIYKKSQALFFNVYSSHPHSPYPKEPKLSKPAYDQRFATNRLMAEDCVPTALEAGW